MKKSISNKNNRGGFTLVELLATIAILSLVSVIVIYTASNIVDNALTKSYKVTINDIQKEANTYVLENNEDIFWLSDGSNKLYQCITVQNLIDMGYFKNDIFDSKVSADRYVKATDYIYIEKDKTTKNIDRQILLYDDNSQLSNLCGSNGLINWDIDVDYPSGWAKEKEVTITYKLDVPVGNLSDYSYSYSFDSEIDEEINERFTNRSVIERKLTVYNDGFLYTKIDNKDSGNVGSKSFEINGIDIIGPDITENTSDSNVRGIATIMLTITDNESGILEDSIGLDDFIVSIGNNILSSSEIELVKVNDNLNTYNYNLKIENYNYAGEVIIKILDNKILDNVGNGNIGKTINTGVVFNNKYTISYDMNGGSGAINNTTCTYGTNCTISSTNPTRTGYTFLGWSENKNATSKTYDSGYVYKPFNEKDDITLYAVWEANTYTIKYNANGGSGTMSDTSCMYGTDCSLRTNSFTKASYSFNGWNTAADGSGTSYSDSQKVKNLIVLDGATITLYAQWKATSRCYKVTESIGLSCNNQPLRLANGATRVVAIPYGYYMTITETVNGNGENWHHVSAISSSSSAASYNCYVIADPSSSSEYTALGGVCPSPSGVITPTPSSPSSSLGGTVGACGSCITHKDCANGGTCTGTCANSYGNYKCCVVNGVLCN